MVASAFRASLLLLKASNEYFRLNGEHVLGKLEKRPVYACGLGGRRNAGKEIEFRARMAGMIDSMMVTPRPSSSIPYAQSPLKLSPSSGTAQESAEKLWNITCQYLLGSGRQQVRTHPSCLLCSARNKTRGRMTPKGTRTTSTRLD